MKCWNCHKEIPDGAKSCSYCEEVQDREPVEPEAREEVLEAIDKAEPGLVDQLRAIAAHCETTEDFTNAILSTGCPACGSEKTETCEDVRGIESIMVGRCIECGKIFCTDCEQAFEKDVVTISSPECPGCGSSDTDFPIDEGDDERGTQEVVTCHGCGVEYCFACGKPLAADDDMPDSTTGNSDLLKPAYPSTTCCNCDKQITDDDSPRLIRIKVRDGVDAPPAREQPYFFDIALPAGMDSGQTKVIAVIVPAKISEARSAGYDLIAPTCSKECASALGEVITSEISFAKEFKITG